MQINNIKFTKLFIYYQQNGQTPREMAESQGRVYTLKMIKNVEKVCIHAVLIKFQFSIM